MRKHSIACILFLWKRGLLFSTIGVIESRAETCYYAAVFGDKLGIWDCDYMGIALLLCFLLLLFLSSYDLRMRIHITMLTFS